MMNGNDGSCLGDLRSHLLTAHKVLVSVREHVGDSRLRRWALGKFCGALLKDAETALACALDSLDGLNGNVLVRGKDGKMRKWEAGCDETREPV